MAELTHALETSLDELRRGDRPMTPELADDLLAALDSLTALRAEVVTLQPAEIDVTPLARRFAQKNNGTNGNGKGGGSPPAPSPRGRKPRQAGETIAPSSPAAPVVWQVVVQFADHIIGSAARAFQVLLALKTMGRVLGSRPSQAEIETASPVSVLTVTVESREAEAALREALERISDVAEVRLTRGETTENTTPFALSADLPDVTVRASVERLDNLLNLVGELVTNRNRLAVLREQLEQRYRNDETVSELSEVAGHLGRLTDHLQEEIMRTRMVPIAAMFSRLPRLARDLARRTGKQVELVVQGADTELDRSVAEVIGDPLAHLLRNAIDHGVESPAERTASGKPATAIVRVSARHEQSQIVVTVEDDGRGLHTERIRKAAEERGLLTRAEAEALSDDAVVDLLFRPGFTTVDRLTEISGRGVELDVVKTNVERFNGRVLVDSRAGQGTRFELQLPLTLAILPALVARAGQVLCAIPTDSVTETLRVPHDRIHTLGGQPVIFLRERTLPLVRLGPVMGVERRASPRKVFVYVIVLRPPQGRSSAGLIVEEMLGQHELVVKSLGALAGAAHGLFGAAILGDGRVALILDIPAVLQWSEEPHWSGT